MNFRTLILSLSILLYLSSCQKIACGGSKQAFLEKHKNFVEETVSSTTTSWDKKDERIQDFKDCFQLFEEEMSTEEKQAFWLENIRYYSVRYEGKIDEFLATHEEELEMLKENLEEIIELSGKQLEDFFYQNEDEIEELIQNIENDIKNWIDQLQIIFEE